jgi:hypothetical protein
LLFLVEDLELVAVDDHLYVLLDTN